MLKNETEGISLNCSRVFYAENRWQMRREYFWIPPEMGKDSNMQHILAHDNLVVFWIFIQFQLRQSNYVQYRSAYLQVVNLNAVPRFIVACDFLIFADIWGLFANAITYTWEICKPKSVQAKQILIGRFVECQSIKKVGGRRSVEELYQALFFVSPFPPECFTERNENRAWSQVRYNFSFQPTVYKTTATTIS